MHALKQAFEIEIVRFCFFQKKEETTVTEVHSLKTTVVTVFRANFTRRIVDTSSTKKRQNIVHHQLVKKIAPGNGNLMKF